ncbi:MAG: LamG domain-containing protein [Myxococcota bacterium]
MGWLLAACFLAACGAADPQAGDGIPDSSTSLGQPGTMDVVEAEDTNAPTSDVTQGKDTGPGGDDATSASPCEGLSDGVPCDDGNACTQDDQCASGVCVGGVNTPCDDVGACQEASCDPAVGCVYEDAEEGAPCQAPCFGNATCQEGTCVAEEASAVICPEPDEPCVDQLSCDPATGACTMAIYSAADTPCDLDENLCTREACDGDGSCEDLEATEDCSAQNLDNPCWTWTCTPKTGCVQTAFLEGNSCDDNNPCSSNDTCTQNEFAQELCVGTPVPIDDSNPCTDDSCIDGVINHAPLDGAVCESECGPGLCDTTECVPSQPCGCASDAECEASTNPCDGKAYCDTATGECDVEPGTAVVCPEVDFPCAMAFCDPALGACAMGPVEDGTLCSDQIACVQDGGCVGQVCQGGVESNCDDQDPCTLDACVIGQGCVYEDAQTAECGFGDLPVAWYRFEETNGPVVDSTGNGHDGTENPGGVTRGVEGAIGLGVSFSGGAGSIQVPAHPDLDFSDAATIEAWVWLGTTSGVGSIVSRGTGNNDNNVLMNSSQGNMQTIFSQTGVGTTNVTSASGMIPIQTWTHIAVVNDGSSLRCYFDGVLVTSAAGGLMGAIANDLFIGQREQGVFAFSGRIDEIKWWTTVRTQEQICSDAEGSWDGVACDL